MHLKREERHRNRERELRYREIHRKVEKRQRNP